MRIVTVRVGLASVGLMACSLTTSPTEYVTETTGAGASGGAPAVGGGGAGTGGADGGSGGAGGGVPTIAAQVFVFGGYRDKPPEFVDANYFEDEVYDVWRADIDAAGMIGEWGHQAPTPLSGVFPVVVSPGTGFLALGLSDDADSSDRYVTLSTTFTAEGIESWSGSVAWDFTNDRDYVRTVAWGSFAYHLVGIEDDSMAIDYYSGRVAYASFDETSGALGTFTDANAVPPARARRSSGAIAAQGVIYLVGGYNAGTKPFVEVSVLAPSTGLPGPWTAQADMMRGGVNHSVYSPSVCVSDTHLYVIGGQGDNGPSDVVVHAPLSPSGTITEWTEAPPMATGGVRNAACFVHGSRLYVLGGEGPSTRSTDVLSAQLAADGTVGDWNQGHVPLPYARSSMSALPVSPLGRL